MRITNNMIFKLYFLLGDAIITGKQVQTTSAGTVRSTPKPNQEGLPLNYD